VRQRCPHFKTSRDVRYRPQLHQRQTALLPKSSGSRGIYCAKSSPNVSNGRLTGAF